MMEQDPESTQFTQTQRGKAKVRNGTRWGEGLPLGLPTVGSPVLCLSGPGALLLLSYSFETGGSGDWEVLQVSEQKLWWQSVMTELLSCGAHFCECGARRET